jgi:hypothetical protein
MRIIGLAVVLAVLALGGGFLLLGRSQSSSSAAVKTIKPLHPVKHHARPARQPVAAKRGHTARKKAPVSRPAVVDGMPAALARALENNDVVVVSLYAPRSSVDAMAAAEAKSGAALAGAGFVQLNVANEKVVAPLTSLLTGAQTAADRVPDDPAVLIFQRPKTLFVRLNGFADRDTVAQAASNAGAVRLDAPSIGAGWASQANAICTQLAGEIQALPFPTSSADAVTWIEGLEGAVDRAVAKLHGLRPPAGQAARVKEMLADYDRAVAGLHRLIAAAKSGQKLDYTSVQAKTAALGKRADVIASRLGATACGGSLSS